MQASLGRRVTGGMIRQRAICPPEIAFNAIADEPYSFFLDSALADQRLGRYAFMGSKPFLVFEAYGRRYSIREGRRVKRGSGDPLDVLGGLLARYQMAVHGGGPPFAAGAVGYISYETGDMLEPLRNPRPGGNEKDCPPDICFAFYESVMAHDLARGEVWISSGGLRGGDSEHRQRIRAADLAALAGSASPVPRPRERFRLLTPLKANFSCKRYMRAVESIKKHIARGDIYQANLTQRFFARCAGSPLEIYLRLRRISPAPFSAYLNFGPTQILSSSPERFLKIVGTRIETRPIKGTRPRGRDRLADRALALELVKSQKDMAEHVMIVDLERNDLGRICETGSVKVTELAALEVYPQVFHLTSTVEGKLRRGMTCADVLRSMFPGGSITGAPKIRSRQILSRIEPNRRGIYTGALGYIDFSGRCDLSIVIRTITVMGGALNFGVGGGVVTDSDPLLEYEESLHKARGLMSALADSVEPGLPA
jgi:para-aminobenzoate synthetase component 1